MGTHAPVRAELDQTLRLAGPLVAGFAGNQLLSVVDTIVAGHMGAEQIAAVGIGGSVLFAGSVIAIGVLLGLDTLASQALGAGEPKIARRFFKEALLVGVALTVPAMLLIVALYFGALEAVGVEPRTRELIGLYLLGRAPSVLPLLLHTALRSYLQANHLTRPVMVSTLIANGLNVPADLALGFGYGAIPAMGVLGIGLSSTIVVVFQALWLWWAMRGLPAVNAGPPTLVGTRKLLDVGLPIGLHMASEMGAFALVTFLMGGLGTLAAGGHQTALMLAAFTFTVCLGISAATAVRVGHAVGRGDSEACLRSGVIGIGTGLAFMSVTAACFLLFPRELASLVVADERVVEVAVPLLRIAGAFQIFDGLQAVASGAMRGAGDTSAAFHFTLIGHWLVGLPFGLLCTYVWGFGPPGLWWGLTLGLATAGIAQTIRFVRVSHSVTRA